MRIAIVDDDAEYRSQLTAYANRYAEENGEALDMAVAADGMNFVSDYRADCDVLFLDVEMPLLDGISTAREIRKVDPCVQIIFLTNYSQYAINGYEVNAIDYVIKPITYFVFQQKLKKALAFSHRSMEQELVLRSERGVVRLLPRQIVWAESQKNYTVYHTVDGDYSERATMRSTMQRLGQMGFAACTAGCMVNLRHVRKVVDGDVYLQSSVLPLARAKKKEFMERYIDYLSGGGRG